VATVLSWAKAGKDSNGRSKATRSEGDLGHEKRLLILFRRGFPGGNLLQALECFVPSFLVPTSEQPCIDLSWRNNAMLPSEAALHMVPAGDSGVAQWARWPQMLPLATAAAIPSANSGSWLVVFVRNGLTVLSPGCRT